MATVVQNERRQARAVTAAQKYIAKLRAIYGPKSANTKSQ